MNHLSRTEQQFHFHARYAMNLLFTILLAMEYAVEVGMDHSPSSMMMLLWVAVESLVTKKVLSLECAIGKIVFIY